MGCDRDLGEGHIKGLFKVGFKVKVKVKVKGGVICDREILLKTSGCLRRFIRPTQPTLLFGGVPD
jgi:hypothetical protein